MKFIFAIAFVCLLSACQSTYQVDSSNQNSPTATTLRFANEFSIIEIDGKPFAKNFSVWADGLHTLQLAEGQHTFKFVYNNSRAQFGAFSRTSHSTKEPHVVTVDMKAGRDYEIIVEYLEQDGYWKFSVVDLSEPY